MKLRVPKFIAVGVSTYVATVVFSHKVSDVVAQEPISQQLPTSLQTHGEQFISGQFSPNGQFFVAKSSTSNGASRTLQIWNLTSPNSPRLISLWKLRNLQEYAIAPHQNIVAVIVGQRQRHGIGIPYAVELRDLRNGAVKKTLIKANSIHAGIYSLAWSYDGLLLATGSGDGLVRVWNTQTGQCIAALSVGDRVSVVQFSPDGNSLSAVGKSNLGVQIWDFRRQVLLRTTPFAAHMPILKFSLDGKILGVSESLSPSDSGAVKLLDITGFSAPTFLASPSSFPYHTPDLAFSDDNRLVATVNPPFIEVSSIASHKVVARINAFPQWNIRLVTLQFVRKKRMLRWVTFQVGADENNNLISATPKVWQSPLITSLA